MPEISGVAELKRFWHPGSFALLSHRERQHVCQENELVVFFLHFCSPLEPTAICGPLLRWDATSNGRNGCPALPLRQTTQGANRNLPSQRQCCVVAHLLICFSSRVRAGICDRSPRCRLHFGCASFSSPVQQTATIPRLTRITSLEENLKEFCASRSLGIQIKAHVSHGLILVRHSGRMEAVFWLRVWAVLLLAERTAVVRTKNSKSEQMWQNWSNGRKRQKNLKVWGSLLIYIFRTTLCCVFITGASGL